MEYEVLIAKVQHDLSIASSLHEPMAFPHKVEALWTIDYCVRKVAFEEQLCAELSINGYMRSTRTRSLRLRGRSRFFLSLHK